MDVFMDNCILTASGLIKSYFKYTKGVFYKNKLHDKSFYRENPMFKVNDSSSVLLKCMFTQVSEYFSCMWAVWEAEGMRVKYMSTRAVIRPMKERSPTGAVC